MGRLLEHRRAHWVWRLLIRSPLPEPAYYLLLDLLTDNRGWRPLHYREETTMTTTPATPDLPELLTADDPRVRDCTPAGVDHDYRTHVGPRPGTSGPGAARDHTYLRCVWCHAISCGDADQTDPCIEPYHHRVPHRTRLGVTWPIGGARPAGATR